MRTAILLLILLILSIQFLQCSDSMDKMTITTSGDNIESSGASLIIDATVCYGCTQESCYTRCPANAVSKTKIGDRQVYYINPESCIKCGICVKNCPFDAITWKR